MNTGRPTGKNVDVRGVNDLPIKKRIKQYNEFMELYCRQMYDEMCSTLARKANQPDKLDTELRTGRPRILAMGMVLVPYCIKYW